MTIVSYCYCMKKMKFSIKNFFCKCDQILNGKLHFLCNDSNLHLYPLSIGKNTFYIFDRILNTPLLIVMIISDIKGFYTTSSQHTLVGLNLIVGTILIFCSFHFIPIQGNLPQEEIPKYWLPNYPIEELLKILRTEMKAVKKFLPNAL